MEQKCDKGIYKKGFSLLGFSEFQSLKDRKVTFLFKSSYYLLINQFQVFRTVLRQQAVSQGNNSRQNPLVLDEEKPEVFLTMLDYMYTNCCTLTFELAPELLTTSIEYGLDGLRRIASRYMADSMSTDNVCIIFQSAVVNMQKELQKVFISNSHSLLESLKKKLFHDKKYPRLSSALIGKFFPSIFCKMTHNSKNNTIYQKTPTALYRKIKSTFHERYLTKNESY